MKRKGDSYKVFVKHYYMLKHSKQYRSDLWRFGVERRYGMDWDVWDLPAEELGYELMLYLGKQLDMDFRGAYKELFSLDNETMQHFDNIFGLGSQQLEAKKILGL